MSIYFPDFSGFDNNTRQNAKMLQKNEKNFFFRAVLSKVEYSKGIRK